jgi:hypothetical protein
MLPPLLQKIAHKEQKKNDRRDARDVEIRERLAAQEAAKHEERSSSV